MLERGDEPVYPPIVFRFKPEFEVMTDEEFRAHMLSRYEPNAETEWETKQYERRERKRRKRAAARGEGDWQPDVLPFMGDGD